MRADVPPIGWRLNTAAGDRGQITLDGKEIPATVEECPPEQCYSRASYAVFNRQTLELVAAGNFQNYENPPKKLLDVAMRYNASPTYLMVVNLEGVPGTATDPRPDERKLLETLGVARMSDADLTRTFDRNVVSIVGVPGSPAGSAFISNDFSHIDPRSLANMSGYLRLNPLSTNGNFEFVPADQTEFDTDTSPGASQITMKVGDQTYAHDVPGDGSSGFFLVRLNSRTLAREGDFFYVTNKPNGAEVPDESKRMAADIASASSPDHERGDVLVMLQAFGHPKGASVGWLQAAAAIARLGGNAQVFAQLNQGSSDEPHQGRYAFVARVAMDTPVAESSQSLTGRAGDGILHGLLARGRDYQYEPLMADPAGTVNFELLKIVNRPSPADGGFPSFTPGEAAAASFLGRDPDIIGVCDPSAPTCDVRKAYYQNYAGTNWANILTRLGEPAKAECALPHPGFTATECDNARTELAREIGRRNTVEEYFGPKGLQAPFLGGAQVGALVDIAKLADEIKNAVKPPESNTTATNALTIISYVVKAGALIPGGSSAAGTLSAAFALAAYLTKPNGSPDLIGPQIATAAANLGSDLYERYQAASAYFTTESKIIMSDWSKMSEVASLVNSPKWKLDDVARTTETVRLATKQAIYQALIPVAYPVLYDLTGVGTAKNWYCDGGITYDKHLFQKTGTGAELTYTMTDPRYYGQRHVIAVGARHTVDRLHDAYVPAPPESLTGPLFRSPDSPQGDGLGFYKIEFYSPQNFEMFPTLLLPRTACSGVPDPPDNAG
ncbi:MAG: hypothetical protein WAL22_06990 [Solirubrobacteraceae bacterium]